MLAVGSILAQRYRVEGVLGQGGMGCVYRARNREGGVVALKEMRVPENQAEEALEQFQREGRLLASLDHPGLVKVIEFFQDGGNHYLAMAFIDGMTLAQAVRKHQGFFPIEQVLDWAEQLCDVLDYLHGRKPPIIFRDLKPSNIMIDRSYRIHLIDFGIARAFHDETQTQTFLKGVGSAGYSPLEQYGAGGTDTRSDIYSLGATLYTLLTAQVPPPVVAVVAGIDCLKSARGINPAVLAPLEAVLVRMMGIRKEDRYASIAEARRALRAAPNDDDPTGTLELTGSCPQGPPAGPRADLGPCVIWKRIGPRDIDFEVPPPVASLKLGRLEPAQPFTLLLGLKSDPDEHSGVTLLVGKKRMPVPNVDLGFKGGSVMVLTHKPGPEMGRDRLLPTIQNELLLMAENLLDERATLPPGVQLTALSILTELARLYEARDDLFGLEQVYRGCLETCLQHPEGGHARTDAFRLNLADFLYAQDRIPEAMSLYEQALPGLEGRTGALTGRGALENKRVMLRILERSGKPGVSECVEEMAGLCKQTGASILEVFSEEIRRRERGEASAGMAPLRLHLARAYQDLGDVGEAESNARRALELAERKYGKEHRLLAPYLKLAAEFVQGADATELETRAVILKYKRSR